MSKKSKIPKDLEGEFEDIPDEEEPQAPEMPEKPKAPEMPQKPAKPIENIIKYEHLSDSKTKANTNAYVYFDVNVAGKTGEVNYNIEEEKIQTFGLEGHVLADDLIAKIKEEYLEEEEEDVDFEEVDENDEFYKAVGMPFEDWRGLYTKKDHSDEELDVFERGRTWLQTEEGKQYFTEAHAPSRLLAPIPKQPDYEMEVKRRIFGSNIVQYKSTKVEDADWIGVEVRKISGGEYKHSDGENYVLLKPGTLEREENVPQEIKKDIVDLYKKKIA